MRSSQVLSDLYSKDEKIATLEERIKALESQLQPEETQTDKIIQFPKLAKRKGSVINLLIFFKTLW